MNSGGHSSPTTWYQTSSPTACPPSPLFFGDVENFDLFYWRASPDLEMELERTVRDAHDACLWLKAAGFPQYVQTFEDGQFPISLSKFQVEKDHSFLEQSALDALIRRLNVLNRCADLMDEIQAKGHDSEDETDTRALSDHWHFKKKSHRWFRKSGYQLEHWGSEQYLPVPSSLASPLLVSELRTSLTDLDRRVKTYSFLPSDDQLPSILVDITRDSISNSLGETTNESLLEMNQSRQTAYTWETESFTIPRGGMDNFATGIIDTFESNLQQLSRREPKSRSLPDVFSASQLYGVDHSTDESPLSSTSVSTTSMLETGKDSSSILNGGSCMSNSCAHMNGHAMHEELHREGRQVMTGVNGTMSKRIGSGGSSGTLESSPGVSELGENERDRQDLSPQPQLGRHSQRSSAGELSFSDLPSPSAVVMRKRQDSTQRRKSKWHSFQRTHCFRQAFKPVRTLIPIEELSAGQISVLRKLSLVKLTALIEMNKTKSNVARILKGKKPKLPDCKNKRMFGVPLSVNVRRTGKALPNTILYAMNQIRETGLETKGLFRRAGSRAKVDLLRAMNEANPDNTNYEGFSVYDISDMIKLYFRELPEPLLTTKFSEILLVIHENIPSQLRLQALQSVMLLMPDENREALLSLLTFLREVAEHADTNQMDANNLAVCFSPTLFSASSVPKLSPIAHRGSFRRTVVNHSPNLATNREITEAVASSHCLATMITNADKLFVVPADMLQVCKFTHLEFSDPVPCHELGQDRWGIGNVHSHIDSCVNTVLREAHRKFKGWVHHDTLRGAGVSFLKPTDGVPLWLWRGTVEVQATHETVLKGLWSQRHTWDGAVTQPRVVSQIDHQTEVYQYVTSSMPPLTSRDHCILRSWRHDPSTDSYVLVATSVSHPSADLLAGIRATELITSYLIEPLDTETCRLTYICRVDLRGRSADFYNSAFGPYLASTVSLVKDSFHGLEFLETPV